MTESLIFVSCPFYLTVVCSLMIRAHTYRTLGQVKDLGNVSNQ